MSTRDHHQWVIDDMYDEMERRERERLYAGIDYDSGPAATVRPKIVMPLPHRESYNVTVAMVKKRTRTLHKLSVLAKDQEHAEFMALAYHSGRPDLAYVYQPLQAVKWPTNGTTFKE